MTLLFWLIGVMTHGLAKLLDGLTALCRLAAIPVWAAHYRQEQRAIERRETRKEVTRIIAESRTPSARIEGGAAVRRVGAPLHRER